MRNALRMSAAEGVFGPLAVRFSARSRDEADGEYGNDAYHHGCHYRAASRRFVLFLLPGRRVVIIGDYQRIVFVCSHYVPE